MRFVRKWFYSELEDTKKYDNVVTWEKDASQTVQTFTSLAFMGEHDHFRLQWVGTDYNIVRNKRNINSTYLKVCMFFKLLGVTTIIKDFVNNETNLKKQYFSSWFRISRIICLNYILLRPKKVSLKVININPSNREWVQFMDGSRAFVWLSGRW